MKAYAAMIAGFALSLSAQVKIVNTPLPMDGDPDGGGWKDVPEQSDFKLLRASSRKKPATQTSFKVAADADNLYLSILCKESKMDQFDKSKSPSKLWSCDSVEIFLSPTGLPDEFYQFVVTAGNLRHSMFYGEAGAITPDPYRPFWDSEVFYGKDYWLVQVRIPFSAFYMTRNAKWSSVWRLNITRSRMIPVRERCTWSPLVRGFMEPQNFAKYTGFPKRDPAQDAAILKVNPVIRDYTDGVYSGPLELTVEANSGAAGTYDLRVEEPDGKSSDHTVTLKGGLNRLVLPKVEYLRKVLGKTLLKLTLKSRKTGIVFGRHYPVEIVYEPVRVEFTAPGYKRNFYPGQDHSKICGQLQLRISAAQQKSSEVQMALSGDGLTEKTQTFKADREFIPFSFDSKDLTEGGKAVLTVKLVEGGKEIASVSQTITQLKKNQGSMVWIENGVIMKNGKPWYPRHIYAFGYRGGEAFMERYKSDDLATSPYRSSSLEPQRLIKEIKDQATKDVKPSPELFKKVRSVVEKNKNNPDFDFYYISDEPECRRVSPVYLKYIYDFVSELDPYHPLVTCTRAASRYINCADIFSTHPYIAPVVSNGKRVLGNPIDRIRSYLQDVTKFKRPDKVVGFTGQFFSYKYLMSDYPTWEEMESMSWSAIVQGSRFHYPYAYHDLGDRPQLYEGFRYFNQSIRALEKQLLSNRKYPVKTDDPENMLDTLLVEGDGVTLLIAVNLKNGPLETVISSDHLKQFKSMFEFRGTGSRKIDNGSLKLSLKPYECVVLTSKKMDAGLKTRDQVAKEVADADKARAARGNLLFEKGATFEVDSSNQGKKGSTFGIRCKLFDGTTDVLGWQSSRWSKEHWFELDFRKNPPKFSKIGIYGYHVDQPTVKIWKFGEWQTLTPKKTDKTKYSTVLDFGEEFKSVKIRINFAVKGKEDLIELYEIELLNDNNPANTGGSAAARSPKSQGEKTVQPADNTLWVEDGKGTEAGKLRLRWIPAPGDKALEIKPKEDGKGFFFFARGNGRKVNLRVKVSPEYPYLVFRITDFELLNGYRNWTVNTEIGNILYSQVTAPQKGIFVFDLFRNLPEKDAAKKAAYLRFWVYNLRMEFEYIKMVKKPAYVVRAECADPVIRPGSKVKFTAELEKEAEDVSISLIGGRPIKVNGSVKIQLKPVDKTQKIWSAEVEIKSIAIKDNKTLGRHRAIMKMDVLGGDLDEPVWVGLPYPVTP